MQLRLDRDVNALYVELRPGNVARTVEVTETIYADLDAEGATLGVEFVDADEFVPFLRERADDERLPPEVRPLFAATAASGAADGLGRRPEALGELDRLLLEPEAGIEVSSPPVAGAGVEH